MATDRADEGTPSQDNRSLAELLAAALPRGVRLTCFHLSTPPTPCAALFHPPTRIAPERTYCESHFLTLAVKHNLQKSDIGGVANGNQDNHAVDVLVFAIELLIYTTESLTTIFVSKADSTGFLRLLSLPEKTPSPLRVVASTFLSFLVRERQRPDTKLVISLFARAQDQYLFPGSIENPGKHVLDDRGLIRWWCRVLDPVLRSYPKDKADQDSTTSDAYLIVPGLDKYETAALYPSSTKVDPSTQKRWSNGHPLRSLSTIPDAPPRCLIPHFPDDPKARFLDELEDEVPDGSEHQHESLSQSRVAKQWKSVRTLEQFWDMMQFRQECSSGRLVGFIWVVFTAPGGSSAEDEKKDVPESSSRPPSRPATDSEYLDQSDPNASPNLGPGGRNPKRRLLVIQSRSRARLESDVTSDRTPTSRHGRKDKHHRLTGPIFSRQPRLKQSTSSYPKVPQALSNKGFHSWPPTSRGQVVLEEKKYHRIQEFLLRLDFENLAAASSSTARWRDEVSAAAQIKGLGSTWGQIIVGCNGFNSGVGGSKGDNADPRTSTEAVGVNTLRAALIKRKGAPEAVGKPLPEAKSEPSPGVTLLAGNLLRKRAKP